VSSARGSRLSDALLADPSGERLFVGTPTNTLRTYAFDRASGALTEVGTLAHTPSTLGSLGALVGVR
jgi:hypothetical protein